MEGLRLPEVGQKEGREEILRIQSIGQRLFPLKKYKGQPYYVVVNDGEYCFWIAKEHVLPDFIDWICQLNYVPWSLELQERFKTYAPRAPMWTSGSETPFLCRDALFLVFKELRNFYDLFACSQVNRHWNRVSKLPMLRPYNGLEGWGLTIVKMGKHQNKTFARAWFDETTTSTPTQKRNYFEWIAKTLREGNCTSDFR